MIIIQKHQDVYGNTYRDETALTNAGTVDNFPGNSASFKYKQKITDSMGDDSTKAVQVIVPLKYLNNV